MAKVTLICVGKNKDKELITLENEYLKRLPKDFFEIVELKAHQENLEKEAEEINHFISSQKVKTEQVILLTENGKEYSSEAFAKNIEKKLDSLSKLYFVIGGASGFSQKIRDHYKESCSLSLLTFPHRIVRLIFVEQIYRALTIIESHPYHK